MNLPSPSSPPARPSTFRPLLGNRIYRRVWWVGALTGVVRWLEMLALGLYGLDATGSPGFVAALVMLRFLPLALFGIVAGALSDAVDPRRLLILGLASIFAVSAVACVLFALGDPGPALAAAVAFLSGVFWAGDLPIRRRMIGEAVEPAVLAGAMSLDGAASNAMRLAGPLAGGALYQAFDIEGVFAFSALVYAAAILIALTLPSRPDDGLPRRASPIRRALNDALDAFALARRSGDVRRILWVTVIFNIWGFPYLAMVPVVARETLGLSNAEAGALISLEGLFAFIGALAVVQARPRRRLRALYVGATLGLLATVFAMGIRTTSWTLAAGLCLGGALTAVFAAMQATLIFEAAPPHMRGRFLGLMTICIGAGVVGFANIGFTAELAGPSGALVIIALEGIVPCLLVCAGWARLSQDD